MGLKRRLGAAGALVVMVGACQTRPLAAQEFLPPEESHERGRFWIGIDGFSTRLGYEFSNDGQGVLAGTLDLGYLGFERFRLRPFGEVGFGGDNDTYVFGTDVLLRLAADRENAIPYFGIGAGLVGGQSCDGLTDCPSVWSVLTLGFEIRVRSRINWLIEYRSEDSFGRHRLFVGLASRRGG